MSTDERRKCFSPLIIKRYRWMDRSSDKSADRPKRWIGLKESSFRITARGFMSDAEYTVTENLRHLICGRRSDGSTAQLFRLHSAYCVDMSTKSLRGRQNARYTIHEGSSIQILVNSFPTSVTGADRVVLLTPSMERGDRTLLVVHSLYGDKSATTIYAHISKMIPCSSTTRLSAYSRSQHWSRHYTS